MSDKKQKPKNVAQSERIKKMKLAIAFRLGRTKRIEQDEICQALGIPKPTWQSYEQGKTNLKPEIAAKLARIYGVSAGWLLSGEGEVFQPTVPLAIVGGEATAHTAPANYREQNILMMWRVLPDDRKSAIEIQLRDAYHATLRDQRE